MATRMQQRRGTAAQWTSANPILAAGEIGFETDTSKFRIGDGVNHWDDLTYYASAAEIAALVDGAPDLLNTLNELAEAIGGDANFADTLEQAALLAEDNANVYAGGLVDAHREDTTNIHGIADTSLLATKAYADNAADSASTSAVADHEALTTSVHGIADVSALATNSSVSDAISTHSTDTTNVHGIADTAELATKNYADGAVGSHAADTTSVHGISDTANLVYASDLSSHASDSTSIHGISDAANLVYAVDLSAHATDTTNVHGIADTAELALLSDVAAVTKTTLGLGNVNNTSDANKPVSTATGTAIATAKSEAIASATSQVEALLAGAPAALNTLDELAAALGDDANFAASVTTSLGLKVDSLTPISQKSASYTLSSLTERDDLIEMGSSSAMTVTIPTDATLNFPIGTSLDILQTSTGQVTIAGAGGVTVNATPGLKLRTQWSSVTLFKRAANTWVAFGDLTA